MIYFLILVKFCFNSLFLFLCVFNFPLFPHFYTLFVSFWIALFLFYNFLPTKLPSLSFPCLFAHFSDELSALSPSKLITEVQDYHRPSAKNIVPLLHFFYTSVYIVHLFAFISLIYYLINHRNSYKWCRPNVQRIWLARISVSPVQKDEWYTHFRSVEQSERARGE